MDEFDGLLGTLSVLWSGLEKDLGELDLGEHLTLVSSFAVERDDVVDVAVAQHTPVSQCVLSVLVAFGGEFVHFGEGVVEGFVDVWTRGFVLHRLLSGCLIGGERFEDLGEFRAGYWHLSGINTGNSDHGSEFYFKGG